MLVLSRCAQEVIRIGDDITIQILEIRTNTVRLGIDAPRDIAVHRGEIHRAIKKKQQSAEPPTESS